MSNEKFAGTWDEWRALSPAQRAALTDWSGMTPELQGLEGWRVEVEDNGGTKRRFIVGVSTGWRPCHLEIATRSSTGGAPVWGAMNWRSVRKIAKVR